MTWKGGNPHGGPQGEAGWTLVETVAVMTIVTVLSAGVGITAVGYVNRARRTAARAQLETFQIALYGYYSDCGIFPTEEQGLNALWKPPYLEPIAAGWNGPYICSPPARDPWGNAYLYVTPGPYGLPFEIMALAPEGRISTAGDELR